MYMYSLQVNMRSNFKNNNTFTANVVSSLHCRPTITIITRYVVWTSAAYM